MFLKIFHDLLRHEISEHSGSALYIDRKVYQNLITKSENLSSEENFLKDKMLREKIPNDHEPYEITSLLDEKISLICVTHNSSKWLEGLIISIQASKDLISEYIFLDNHSTDNTVTQIKSALPESILISQKVPISLAGAINLAVERASGDYFFIINPDITFDSEVVFRLYSSIFNQPNAAAVVPKLHLMKNPEFINGIGNIIKPFRWGFDLGLGHLDLGQFDAIKEVPSACFAAVMVPRDKWEVVGSLDEAYPLYYEDSDWCYRSRLMGSSILISTDSIVYHAYGGHQKQNRGISDQKLKNVTYGRLRLITKYADFLSLIWYGFSYFVFDIIFMAYSIFRVRPNLVKAIISGWRKYFSDFSEILKLRSDFRKKKEENPFKYNKEYRSLSPRIMNGYPIVTWSFLQKYLHFVKKGK